MGDRIPRKDQAAKRAEEAFKSAERRDIASKQITATEYATSAAKTNKLRALRIAKEATDLQAKDDMANRRKRR